MANLADVRDRLQPALLDRLTDDAPQSRVEAEDTRVMSKTQLRQAVLRTWVGCSTPRSRCRERPRPCPS
jgi:hypothetical protein